MGRKSTPQPRSERAGHAGRRDSSRRWEDHYERNRRRYFMAFETLASVIVDPRGYFGALKEFLVAEYRHRAGLFAAGVLFLAGAVFLLGAFLMAGFLSAFLFLDSLIRNPALTAFALAWVALVLCFVLAYLSLRKFQRMVEPRRRS